MSGDPLWVQLARGDIGLREVPGSMTEPRIAKWLGDLKAWWRDDETPWCGTACAAWMRASGAAIPKNWFRAKAWADWGQHLDRPAYGCIVVFERQGGGHVGLVVGEDTSGRLLVLGGNQGDAVNIRAFPRDRAIAYRWPIGWPMPAYEQLAQGIAAATTGEA